MKDGLGGDGSSSDEFSDIDMDSDDEDGNLYKQ